MLMQIIRMVGGNFTRYKSEEDRTTVALKGAITKAREKAMDGVEERDDRSQKRLLTKEENLDEASLERS